ncbi:MAG: hypothetical protein WBM83_01850 [Flavobacteriaceae bacterium]
MKNVIAIFLVLLFTGCNGQEKESQETENNEIVEQPKGEWKVNREYDEAGNLIKYDSIYGYSYSNIDGDSLRVNLDSIMDAFKGYFREHQPFNWNNGFSFFPENDSLFMKDFFKDDYFIDHWVRQPIDMEQMMKRMDSVRNQFLKKYHPGLLESQEEKN